MENLAYMLRYVFALLVVLTAVLLLNAAVSEFRGGIKRNLRPTFGYFLITMTPANSPRHPVKSLPLFHTTMVGSGRNCDIRLKSGAISRRHGLIYVYDGDWFIRPHKRNNFISIEGIPITEPTPLRNHDRITFGDTSLIFVDEKAETEAAGLPYTITTDSGLEELERVPGGSPTAFWLVNFFGLSFSALFVGLLKNELAYVRAPIALILSVFWFIFNLYYLVLPKLLIYVDKVILLAVTQLCYLGVVIQLRLALLTPSVLNRAIEVNDGDIVAAAMRLISPQMISLAVGLIVLPIVTLIVAKTRFLEVMVPVCVVLTPLLLVVTLIFGRGDTVHGASLWINVGGMSLQLTEFAKITYLVVLAQFFKNRPQLRTQLAFAVWAGMVFLLIMLLPDLGSIMILLPVTLAVFLVMTSEFLTTFTILGGTSALAVFAYTTFPHVRRRLAGWTTLWEEVNDSNRQIVYGLQAMARGGLLGRGLGNGSPEGIPVVASDMVFTIVCEEMGLLIGLSIVLFFIVIWLRGARTMPLVKDGFSSSMILAVCSLFFVEAAIVIAGCTGLIPLTGVTLPFISQGGSSLLAKMILISILLGLMSRRNELVVAR